MTIFRRSIALVSTVMVLASVGVACTIPPTPNPEPTFPLALNNSWVFQFGRYEGFNPSEIMTAMHVVTETVVEVRTIPPYSAARIHRDESAETPVYVPSDWQEVPVRPANASDYWLVVDGNRIYRQEKNLDLTNLSKTGELELVFPLQVGEKWYLFDGGIDRQVTKVDGVTVPAGRFGPCFFFEDGWVGSTTEAWFCPGVGFVDQKMLHNGTPDGWRQTLISYHVQ